MSSEIKNTLLKAGHVAENVAKDYIEKGFRVDLKGVNNLVTEADLACEKVIVETIKETFPNHQFLGEEEVKADILSDDLWIIDPIDGTNNFAHNVPHAGISIAYAKAGEICAGVVINPYNGETFFAEKNQGAFLNDQKISVSTASSITDALVATGFYYDYGDDVAQGLKAIEILIKEECHGIRRLGACSLDLCFVACGRFDAYYELRLNAWDFAAGVLLVREAGGVVTTPEGNPLGLEDKRLVTSCNETLQKEIIRIVDEAK